MSSHKINIPSTEPQVTRAISSLKNKILCGYDGLSNKIRKLCSSQISILTTYIYNKSITCGICPDCLKYADIKPCFNPLIGHDICIRSRIVLFQWV
jgi:hypothetical protein